MNWDKHVEWLLNHIQVGIHLVDQQGFTLFYNQTMANIDGLNREQVLGKNIFQLFPSLTDETSTLNLALQRGEEVVDQVQTYVNWQGKQITSINSTYPIYEADKVMGAVEIAQDITSIMKLYDQILDLRKQLRESKQKNHFLQGTAHYHFSDLIGKNEAFQHALAIAKKASRTHSPVMIYGPTGTGKELLAQSIHNASIRKEHPFLALNCAAVPKELLEALLFGTTRGAFTGSTDRAGIFEQAHGGTLFLDELNSLDLFLQAKLLRVLQDGIIRRLGETKEQAVDVRIITAMNINPQEAVDKEILRSDLFFRLSVVNIFLPPLMQRKEDIPLLVEHFIQKFNQSFGTHVQGISENALQRLITYNWPGNVRELEHAIESAFNLIEIGHDLLEEHHFPSPMVQATTSLPFLPRKTSQINLPKLLAEFERQMIQNVWKEHKGNISKTAETLGLKRQALQYKLNKYGIQKNS